MINLFDIARTAQGGSGLDSIARQFGLDGQQTRSAVDGLLPAFSMALRRTAQDAGSFANFIDLMGSGRYARFFDAPGLAVQGGGAGRDVLGQLFGSDEASRRVAEQVSAATGVGLQAIQQIMPALAGLLAGGLFKYATANGYADLLRDWSDALKGTPHSASRPSAQLDPWSAWTEMAAAMTRPKPPKPPAPDMNPLKPWSDMVGVMLGAPAKPEPPPPPPTPNPFEALTQMFEAGREAQAHHLASFQAILDSAWGAKS